MDDAQSPFAKLRKVYGVGVGQSPNLHGRTWMIVFPLIRLVGLESGDGFVEGRDVADVRPQSSVPHPLHDLTQLGRIGLDNKVDRQTVVGPRLGGPTTDTSVPPARTRPADRFPMSPPMG